MLKDVTARFKHVRKIYSASELSSPRVCLLSCHDDNYKEMAEITVCNNKREYAERWRHDLYTLTSVSRPFHDAKSHVGGLTWDRLNVALHIAQQPLYDWIYIVGCDTMITNMTIPLASLIDVGFEIVIANDCNGWNADSFLVRCCPASVSFLREALRQRRRLGRHCWVEQQAMIEIRDRFPNIAKTLPQRSMNSYNYDLYDAKGGRGGMDFAGNDGQWQAGDFLIHWAGLPTHVRMAEIKRVLPLVVR